MGCLHHLREWWVHLLIDEGSLSVAEALLIKAGRLNQPMPRVATNIFDLDLMINGRFLTQGSDNLSDIEQI